MKSFSVDAEVDGLYGSTLAIAAVARIDGQTVAEFQGRVALDNVQSDWVRENVVPAIAGILEVYASCTELEEAFWEFWMAHRDGAIATAHCGAPVETSLFRRCIERDLTARQWNGPFPLHEVGSMLLLRGHNPASVEEYLKKEGLAVPFAGQPHHPMYDALAAAVAAERLLMGGK
jgi:hypothetical protein